VQLVSPVTVIGLCAPEAIIPPGLDVTVYLVIGSPGEFEGALKLTAADESPGVAVIFVGGPGTAAGITGLEGVEAGPAPIALVAVTVNV
jgi:hypothetical protein